MCVCVCLQALADAAAGLTAAGLLASPGPPAALHVAVYQKRPLVGDLHLGDVAVSAWLGYM